MLLPHTNVYIDKEAGWATFEFISGRTVRSLSRVKLIEGRNEVFARVLDFHYGMGLVRGR